MDKSITPDTPDPSPQGMDAPAPGGTSRRDFLKSSALGLTAAALPVGVAGAGSHVFAADLSEKVDSGPGSDSGDLVLVNGRFVDGRGKSASAMTIKCGRIAKMGVQAMGRDVRVINLKGKTVIPGLINGHVHHSRTGTNAGHEVRTIETAFSIRELQEIIARRTASVPPGEFISCHLGWHYVQLAENRLPTKAELDAAAPHHKVFLSGRAGFVEPLFAVTNSLGQSFFQGAGLTVDDATGRIAATPETAFNAIRNLETPEDRLRQTYDNNAWTLSLGETEILDPAGSPTEANYPAIELWRQGRLHVRHRLHFTASSPAVVNTRASNMVFRGFGDDMLRAIGFGEQLGTFATTAWAIAEQGWKLQQHTDFFAQVDERIGIFQDIANHHPIQDFRWQLIHAFQTTAPQLQALKNLGVGLDLENERYLDRLERGGGPFFRLILHSGVKVGIGTDGSNFAPNNPWLMMYYMTTGVNVRGIPDNAEQTITRMEALRWFTAGSAFQAFDDDKLGSFEVGKLADLAVLNEDFRTVSDERLRRIKSVLTVVGGKIVHEGDEPQWSGA
jgi:predicted amidohydrolase YtcJ